MATPPQRDDRTEPSPDAGQPRLSVQQEHGVKVLRFPRGQIDGNGVREMYEQAIGLMDRPNVRLLIDLAGVEMISSGAMGMLVTINKKSLGVGAQMHVAVPGDLQMGAFRTMNLDRVLKLFADASDALRHFKPSAIS